MGATPAADVPRSAPAHVSLEAKAPAAASRVYDEEYSMAMAEQSAMAAEAAVKSDKTTKAVEAKAKVAEVQKNKDEMLRLKDSVKADVLAARGKELAAKRLESSSQASSEVATEVKEGKAVKEVKGAKEAKGEKKAEKPGFWPFTSWDEKEEKEEPLDVGVLQAVVADDIAKAKDGSLQAGEGHFKFGVSAGKRPSPTSTTSASSTKLDIVKPATTDLHHTTLSDEHHKPDAMKEMPAHPATTSKGAASYLEGAKKVAAASASSKSGAATKSGAAAKGVEAAAAKAKAAAKAPVKGPAANAAAAAASELKAKKTTDFHKVAWGASGNGPHKAKTAAATLVSHDSGAKRAANALLKPAGGKQAARQAQARRAANLAQTETASTAAGVKSAAHLAKEAAAKKPSALSTTTKLSQKAAAAKSAAKSASAASKTAAPAAAAGVKSAAHLAKEAKEAKAAGVKSAAHLANDAKEAKAKAHATAAKEAPFSKAAWGATSNGPHKGNKAAAKAKATALLSKEAKARRAHLPKKAGGASTTACSARRARSYLRRPPTRRSTRRSRRLRPRSRGGPHPWGSRPSSARWPCSPATRARAAPASAATPTSTPGASPTARPACALRGRVPAPTARTTTTPTRRPPSPRASDWPRRPRPSSPAERWCPPRPTRGVRPTAAAATPARPPCAAADPRPMPMPTPR